MNPINKPISLVKDATCYHHGGPGTPPTGVNSCRCKCYHDWRLDSWDEHWNQTGCSNSQGGWNYYDWRENPMGGSGTGCCAIPPTMDMGRTDCLSECEAYCGSDSVDDIRHNQNRNRSNVRRRVLSRIDKYYRPRPVNASDKK